MHKFCKGLILGPKYTIWLLEASQLTNKEEVFKILSNVDPEKACGLHEIPCRMLKDDAEILAESITNSQHVISFKVF